MTSTEICPEVRKALESLLALAANDAIRIACQKELLVKGCRLVYVEGEDFLFGLPRVMRADLEQYRMFVRGHLLEVRRLDFFDLKFSMINFPPGLVGVRPEIEAQFAVLWRRSEACTILFGGRPWEDPTVEQQGHLVCTFVEDNVQYHDW